MLSFFSGRILFLLGWLRKISADIIHRKSADANDRKDFMDMFRNALSDMKLLSQKKASAVCRHIGAVPEQIQRI